MVLRVVNNGAERPFLCLFKFSGSEKSSPQGYKITFEMLSQKIVSGNEESFIKYFGNKSAVNKKSVIMDLTKV